MEAKEERVATTEATTEEREEKEERAVTTLVTTLNPHATLVQTAVSVTPA